MPYTENKTIGGLDPANGVGANDLFVLSQSGVAKRAAVSDLEAKILGDKPNLSAPQSTDTVIIRSAGQLYDTVLTSLVPAGTITETKLAANAVTSSKLQSSAGTDSQRAVTTSHIRDGAVTTPKLGPLAVQTGNLAASAVVAEKIALEAVTGDAIAAAAVDLTKFGPQVFTDSYTSRVKRLMVPNPANVSHNEWYIERQGDVDVAAATREAFFSYHRDNVAALNQEGQWALSFKTCKPTFIGWTQESSSAASKGGAYSGGVLLPDGRVFLVPYNAPPAIYDPQTDSVEELGWPGGVPPNGINQNYAHYFGGALVPSSSLSAGQSGFTAFNPNSGDFSVVCAPFYAKKPLVFSLFRHECYYGQEVAGLPDRAFGGISVAGTRLLNNVRCAFLAPHATGSAYLVNSKGEMSVVPGGLLAAGGWGAQMQPNSGDIVFGNYYYRPANNTWLAGTFFRNFPTLTSAPSDSSDTAKMLGVAADGEIYSGAGTLIGQHPAAATVSGFKASGVVYMEDYWNLVVPGYWGSGVAPKLLLVSAYFANQTVELPMNLGTNITDIQTAAPGNGLFAGGVRLLDGRVLLVPCTSQKAYIIETRMQKITGSSEYHLGPFYNKR